MSFGLHVFATIAGFVARMFPTMSATLFLDGRSDLGDSIGDNVERVLQ